VYFLGITFVDKGECINEKESSNLLIKESVLEGKKERYNFLIKESVSVRKKDTTH
jgi:hypothetical protein